MNSYVKITFSFLWIPTSSIFYPNLYKIVRIIIEYKKILKHNVYAYIILFVKKVILLKFYKNKTTTYKLYYNSIQNKLGLLIITFLDFYCYYYYLYYFYYTLHIINNFVEVVKVWEKN